MIIFIELLKKFWPYIVAFMLGATLAGGVAWKVQGLRLTSAKQEFAKYKLDQDAAEITKAKAADKQRKGASDEYDKLKTQLDAQITAGDVYKRCVAAGKCGVRQSTCSGSGIRLPTAVRTDEGGSDAVPVGQEGSAEGDPVINDCAVTTLMLNRLQMDVEAQPGYNKE